MDGNELARRSQNACREAAQDADPRDQGAYRGEWSHAEDPGVEGKFAIRRGIYTAVQICVLTLMHASALAGDETIHTCLPSYTALRDAGGWSLRLGRLEFMSLDDQRGVACVYDNAMRLTKALSNHECNLVADKGALAKRSDVGLPGAGVVCLFSNRARPSPSECQVVCKGGSAPQGRYDRSRFAAVRIFLASALRRNMTARAQSGIVGISSNPLLPGDKDRKVRDG